jgi:putative ABC transport system permease protein
MLALSLKGFGARKVRVALTVIAVALGVALISGTYVLTDTINKSFDQIFQTAAKGTDVSVTARDAVDDDQGGTTSTMPASYLARVKSVPGVDKAVGAAGTENAAAFKSNGDRIGNETGGAPTQIFSDTPPPFDALTYVEGKRPAGPGQVALLQSTADDEGIKIGDTIQLIGAAGPRQDMKVVGLAKFGGVSSVGGFVAVVTTLPEAQKLAGKRGQFDEILVSAKPGVTPDALRNRIKQLDLANVNVRTGVQQADQNSQDIRDQLGFLRTALLAFAGISLFVGAFIIFNTFSITVAQRMREFALLRTLGASRRQVMGQVLFEGLLIGVIGSVVGLLLGLALAPGLRALFKAVGADLPSSGTVIATRTIVVSLLVGIIVTLLSGLAPAIRSTKVPPVAALREGAVLPHGRGHRFITPGGIVLTVLGALGLALGLFGSGGVSLVGLGAALIFIGVALLSPKLVPPLANVVGRPLPGLVGRLARENSVRQPGRTAVTAAALMIGVTLVAFVSIFAQGAKATINQAVDTAAKPGTLIVQNTNGFTPISPAVAQGLRHVPGVKSVSPVSFSTSRVAGVPGKTSVTGVPASLPDVFNTDWKQGSDTVIRGLGSSGAVLTKGYAEDNDLKVGSRLNVLTPTNNRIALTVRGILDDNTGLFADLTVSDGLARTQFGEKEDALVFAGVSPADEQQVKTTITKLLDRFYPVAEVKTIQEYKDEQAAQINQLLVLIYVLLLLAVIISLFGIVNTLVLSIYERTRELGMLRAIGTSRRQVRRMIRYEAVITSLIGAVIGIVLGIIFALAIGEALKDDGFVTSFPVGQLILLLVLGALAGVLAAILPARRASRLDVLESLAYE